MSANVLEAARAEFWRRCREIDAARAAYNPRATIAAYMAVVDEATLAETEAPAWGRLLDELFDAERRRSTADVAAAIERYRAGRRGELPAGANDPNGGQTR